MKPATPRLYKGVSTRVVFRRRLAFQDKCAIIVNFEGILGKFALSPQSK